MSLPILRPTYELGDYLWSIAEEANTLFEEAEQRGFGPEAMEVLAGYVNTYCVAESEVADCRLRSNWHCPS